jgi:hypothetical protein
MAWGSTQSLTINSVAYVMNRINQDSYGSEWYYTDATRTLRMFIRHSSEKANALGIVLHRYNIEVQHTIKGVAPALDDIRYYSTTWRASTKADPAQLLLDTAGFSAFINNSTRQTDMLAYTN